MFRSTQGLGEHESLLAIRVDGSSDSDEDDELFFHGDDDGSSTEYTEAYTAYSDSDDTDVSARTRNSILQTGGAEFRQRFQAYYNNIPAEVPVFDAPRCPKFHELRFHASKSTGWACDCVQLNRGTQVFQEKLDKQMYGIKDSEEWHCLSGCTDFNQMDDVPVYRCSRCCFDLCFRCYERAKEGLERMKVVADALKSTEKVEWMQSKLMIVGEGRAGKTSTVRSLMGQSFVQDLDSTIGASLTYARGGAEAWQNVDEIERNYTLNAAIKQSKMEAVTQGHGEQVPVQTPVEKSATEREVIERERLKKRKEGGKRKRKKRKNGKGAKGQEEGEVGEEKEEEEEEEGEEKEEKEEEEDGEKKDVMDIAEVAGRFKLDLLDQSLEGLNSIKYTIWDYGE